MLHTEAEERWSRELERRKRKVIEEEQTRLDNFNAQQQSLLIFSHIFRIAPKLKRLPKRTRSRLKHREICLNQQYARENKLEDRDTKTKVKEQEHLLHNYKSRCASHLKQMLDSKKCNELSKRLFRIKNIF